MQFQVKSFCDEGKFSQAIKAALGLPANERLPTLEAIKDLILKTPKSLPRDIILGELMNALLTNGGDMTALAISESNVFQSLNADASFKLLITQVESRKQKSIRDAQMASE